MTLLVVARMTPLRLQRTIMSPRTPVGRLDPWLMFDG